MKKIVFILVAVALVAAAIFGLYYKNEFDNFQASYSVSPWVLASQRSIVQDDVQRTLIVLTAQFNDVSEKSAAPTWRRTILKIVSRQNSAPWEPRIAR